MARLKFYLSLTRYALVHATDSNNLPIAIVGVAMQQSANA